MPRLLAILAIWLPATPLVAESLDPSVEFTLRDYLVVSRITGRGRVLVRPDVVQALRVSGDLGRPAEGGEVAAVDERSASWQRLEASEEGELRGREVAGAYAFAVVESPRDAVMTLEARGPSVVWVNGEPRGGDVYSSGWIHYPVRLRAGENEFLFQVARGRLSARLVPTIGRATIETRGGTVPDAILGEEIAVTASVTVTNLTGEPLRGLRIEPDASDAFDLPPVFARLVPVRLRGPAPVGGETSRRFSLRLVDAAGEELGSTDVALEVRRLDEAHQRTFVSEIDGSVQYYAVQPASRDPRRAPPALILSLHGASVEARGQARAYSQKSWAHVIAPTNRRPYGFDWEDFGRIDAMEALADAKRRYTHDPSRVYLTGHSMGGHGTWHVGVTFPDRFAAIGPSAGWVSFRSYGGGERFEEPSPVEALLARANAPGDTLALATNLAPLGVYVLHGDADDNVPISEARTMLARLAEFHRDHRAHEQPGAGHWWDDAPEPGASCVDWAPMLDFFARRRVPSLEEVRFVDFTTMNPEVSAECHWARVEAQIVSLAPSRIELRLDPLSRRYSGTTSNVRRLSLDPAAVAAAGPSTIGLDGQTLEVAAPHAGSGRIWLERGSGEEEGAAAWRVSVPPSADRKGSRRAGPFKHAFGHRVILVHATSGTEEENAWSYARARFDAETFWYRGNGTLELLADVDATPERTRGRSVVIYGHREMNAAWGTYLADCPIDVRRGTIRIGDDVLAADDLCALFIRPRADDDAAAVGVVAGSGGVGNRLTEVFPVFTSGIGFPDWLVADARVLREGTRGIRAAGYFGDGWEIDAGQTASGVLEPPERDDEREE